MEHHQGGQQDLLGAVAADRRDGRRAAVPRPREVYYKGHLVESMERIRGKGKARIDYRHIIGSLVRKPGAFAATASGSSLYPTHTFRGVRRDVRLEGRASRCGLRPDPAPCRDDDGM